MEHLEGDGAVIFEHACKLGLEGVVCKRIDLPYWPGPSKSWIKVDFGFCVFCLASNCPGLVCMRVRDLISERETEETFAAT